MVSLESAAQHEHSDDALTARSGDRFAWRDIIMLLDEERAGASSREGAAPPAGTGGLLRRRRACMGKLGSVFLCVMCPVDRGS